MGKRKLRSTDGKGNEDKIQLISLGAVNSIQSYENEILLSYIYSMSDFISSIILSQDFFELRI